MPPLAMQVEPEAARAGQRPRPWEYPSRRTPAPSACPARSARMVSTLHPRRAARARDVDRPDAGIAAAARRPRARYRSRSPSRRPARRARGRAARWRRAPPRKSRSPPGWISSCAGLRCRQSASALTASRPGARRRAVRASAACTTPRLREHRASSARAARTSNVYASSGSSLHRALRAEPERDAVLLGDATRGRG